MTVQHDLTKCLHSVPTRVKQRTLPTPVAPTMTTFAFLAASKASAWYGRGSISTPSPTQCSGQIPGYSTAESRPAACRRHRSSQLREKREQQKDLQIQSQPYFDTLLIRVSCAHCYSSSQLVITWKAPVVLFVVPDDINHAQYMLYSYSIY